LNGTFTEVQLISALDRILGNAGLSWIVKDGVVMITTTAAAAQEPLISVDYRVGPLTYSANNPASRANSDYDTLMSAIRDCVDVTSWTNFGGPGSIKPRAAREGQGTITVQQSWRGHWAVSQFLDQLRAASR
jgi:hypothetical protein